MSSEMKDHIDVLELWGILQCLGFSMKSIDMNDVNINQDAGTKVVITCQCSGIKVIFESNGSSCSCPPGYKENSGFWQVSGIAGGKQQDKEYGCALLRTLPKAQRDQLSSVLHDIIGEIKDFNVLTEPEKTSDEQKLNKSASLLDIKSTPEKKYIQLKAETPTRYRSLDTLTSNKDDAEQSLPAPRPLQKPMTVDTDTSADEVKYEDKRKIFQKMYRRQGTYSISPTSSITKRNKTSSPINTLQNTTLERLIAAQNIAEELRNKLAVIIREFKDSDEGNVNSSTSSLALDVSKISIFKVTETTKAQFASSPNLSKPDPVNREKNNLKRVESASTSNLAVTKLEVKEGKTSKLRRLSPSFFKNKKDGTAKEDKIKIQGTKSTKLNSLFKAKVVTPVCSPRTNFESSPKLSSSRNKFSHIKSTIPRPTPKKE